MASTTVSAKIPSKLREELRRYDVDISATVRRALAEEVSRREAKELENSLVKLRDTLSEKITKKDIVEAVRSSRNER